MNCCRLLCLALALIIGCHAAAPTKPASVVYPIRGKVVAVDPAKPSITIDHEDIPGLMGAMTMTFDVGYGATAVLPDLKPGDTASGDLRIENGTSTIVRLEKEK